MVDVPNIVIKPPIIRAYIRIIGATCLLQILKLKYNLGPFSLYGKSEPLANVKRHNIDRLLTVRSHCLRPCLANDRNRTPSQYADRCYRYGIDIIKIKRSCDSLIFLTGILILVRRHHYIGSDGEATQTDKDEICR